MVKIILASQSRVRKEILDKNNIPNEVKPSGVDEEAIKHCNDPETSSLTCTNQHRKNCIGGDWFDGFERYK